MDVREMTKYREAPGEMLSIRSEVLECLVAGLQFLKSDAEAPAQKLAQRILANIIIEHLDISGFSIHRKPLHSETIPREGNVYSLPTM
jgi:hypothetical protein